jgi:exopolyphosphatase / guanosine-5'-triphosphate,3'-diphosphate pyrophosphatase
VVPCAGYRRRMRLGVLDIGSNSAQLQVVDAWSGGPPLPAHVVKEPTLLGEAFDAAGAIEESAVDRVVDAVRESLRAAQRFSVERLYVFATAAIRDATNREQVLSRIAQETGVRPQCLLGEDEARLTYLAVRRWYGWSAGRLLLLDIGGGSMEVVLGRDSEPALAVSLPLGAGLLTRRFLPDDRPSGKQLDELGRHVRSTLREITERLRWEGDPTVVVATSKTFKQLARLTGAPPRRNGPFVRRELRADDLAEWIPRLAGMPAKKRARLRGVSRCRSRQLVAGAMVAAATMDALDIPGVEVCPWALRQGIFLQHIESAPHEGAELPLEPVRPHPLDRAAARPVEVVPDNTEPLVTEPPADAG